MTIVLYLASIVLANVLTAAFMPLQIGPFLITLGTFVVGSTFFLRDMVQEQYGRLMAYKAILLALVLSAISSSSLGDTLWIVVASAISFLVSETADTEVYTRLKLPIKWRVLWSGTVGGILDSAIFVLIGISPLGAGFIPWEAVIYAILGQIVAKFAMQVLAMFIIKVNP